MTVGSWRRTDTCHDTCHGIAQMIKSPLFYWQREKLTCFPCLVRLCFNSLWTTKGRALKPCLANAHSFMTMNMWFSILFADIYSTYFGTPSHIGSHLILRLPGSLSVQTLPPVQSLLSQRVPHMALLRTHVWHLPFPCLKPVWRKFSKHLHPRFTNSSTCSCKVFYPLHRMKVCTNR
jgi:hypothetical protein